MIDLTIDAQRIQDQLNQLATYSDTPHPAITRVLFTETELKARAYIRELMSQAGLDIYEDAIGNIFGRWAGANSDLPVIATGSHIDAIPYSGMYDGTVGVIGAIEAIRALKNSDFEPTRTLEVIMFTSEEPTRFGLGCLGSRAMAGILSSDDLLALQDNEGYAFDEVRQSAGYSQPIKTVLKSVNDYEAFIELHIEQGKRLEESQKTIGIVTAIAAPATLRVVIEGDGGHAGAVLMPNRRDALLAASEIIIEVEKAATQSSSPDAVATVGLCDVYPGAVNSIPSRVTLEIDIRDINLASRDAMVSRISEASQRICTQRQLQSKITVLNANKPSTSGAPIIEIIKGVTQTLGYSYQTLVSRAYHDTLFMAELCPTSMIFIPSENGYSHRPDEFTSIEDITKGATVLAHTLAKLSTKID